MALRKWRGQVGYELHVSCEGLREGERTAGDCLLQRDGSESLQDAASDSKWKGVPFAVAGDVKILGPPKVIKEMAEGFPTLVWEEAGLTTQTVKNRIFVHASAQVR